MGQLAWRQVTYVTKTNPTRSAVAQCSQLWSIEFSTRCEKSIPGGNSHTLLSRTRSRTLIAHEGRVPWGLMFATLSSIRARLCPKKIHAQLTSMHIGQPFHPNPSPFPRPTIDRSTPNPVIKDNLDIIIPAAGCEVFKNCGTVVVPERRCHREIQVLVIPSQIHRQQFHGGLFQFSLWVILKEFGFES